MTLAVILCALSLKAQGLTATRVFADIPLEVLDLLRPSSRLDMIDYYEQADSLVSVENALGDISHFEEVAPDYLRVRVSPVSTLEIKILPAAPDSIVMTLHTVGSDTPEKGIADTEVKFFDRNLNPLPADKFLKLPPAEQFFNLKNSGISARQFREMIPFEAVSLSAGPTTRPLTAHFTALAILPDEIQRQLLPLLHSIAFQWNGKGFSVAKKPGS